MTGAVRWWYGAMALGGFGFGLLSERRPFGADVLAHPLVVYAALAGLALIGLRIARARPVPELIPERSLLYGCLAGLAAFLLGNFIAIHLIGAAH
jgi:hypothetical protein